MQELMKCKSEAKIRKSLNEAPKGLQEMIRHVLASFSATCEPEELEFLNEQLLWTACSPKPLMLRQAGDILRFKSPDGDGMIYLEGALRRQFESFFTLNRWDNLNTAELEILAMKTSALEQPTGKSVRSSDGDLSDAFDAADDFIDFTSYSDTTITFCHASIGDFFRDEKEGKVAAGRDFTPVGVDWRDGKVHILKTSLRIIMSEENVSQGLYHEAAMPYYVVDNLSHHLQSTPPSYATGEDQSHIASMLIKLFSNEKKHKSFSRKSLSRGCRLWRISNPSGNGWGTRRPLELWATM
ncbi:uncharacterized protein N7484_007509 [Penicillium longicatenatum]|uniref:uncharacterized protein n=1 Tax=Penicillium longicatenatum TaxID=1561947 RepID=UPI002548687E|nr:uncharacterized protein N7484_007509 [Penicillium longicatenatum]KAJ5639647.1 hypothetical protein N7484_007509 [Penicillium longicatenatum]